MRSLFSTLLQLFIAIVMLVLVGILLSRGNLHQIFGVPPTPQGERLYTDFTPADITKINLSTNGVTAKFSRASGVWMMTEPAQDRMDPRWAKTLIDFSLATRATDVIPNEKIDETQAGLKDGMVYVRLADDEGKARAKYVIGRRTAWITTDAETEELVPTVFLQPRDRSRKSHIYACTGDIRPIFKDGLRYFRDHQPFLFAPSQLQKIHIKSDSSEFMLETTALGQPWRITKPQKLSTETEAVKSLIEKGLFSLRALRVLDKEKVTLPSIEDDMFLRIAIQSFGQTEPVTLSVYPSADDKANTVYATVSDRPGTVFELPLRPYPDLVSLSELPLTNYNNLRAQNLTGFDHKKLQAITINTAKASPIQLSLPPRGSWRIQLDEATSATLNEVTHYKFIKTITETKVAGFLTDNAFLTDEAKDLETYGLKSPLVSIQFRFKDQSSILLRIGKTKDGVFTAHLNHPETLHTIVKLPDDFIARLPLRIKQWKDTRLLAIASIDFINLERNLINQPKLKLNFNYRDEAWESFLNDENTTGTLNIARANKLLETLGDLRVNSWLNSNDQDALNALATPALKLNILKHKLNEFGEHDGYQTHILEVTPVSTTGQSEFFYGRLSGEDDLFLLDRKTALLLALDLFKETL
ncbi:MAG: hypothetical protein CAK88_08835 [Verrucomicrobiia bacterium AMD-G2]|nr:MAG: hypothetical protein CAK88_08835 [Verrucomicrobiae bacterium AMD-G2]